VATQVVADEVQDIQSVLLEWADEKRLHLVLTPFYLSKRRKEKRGERNKAERCTSSIPLCAWP